MKAYSSVSFKTGRPTGVLGYDFGADFIVIYFKGGSVYKYTAASCGASCVQEMIRLAESQQGLNTYVVKNKPAYESKY